MRPPENNNPAPPVQISSQPGKIANPPNRRKRFSIGTGIPPSSSTIRRRPGKPIGAHDHGHAQGGQRGCGMSTPPDEGVFARWQPLYAEKRIATFPVGSDKKPQIRRWNKVGLSGSARLAQRLRTPTGLGFNPEPGRDSPFSTLILTTTPFSLTH
jgi:hypothetical protein